MISVDSWMKLISTVEKHRNIHFFSSSLPFRHSNGFTIRYIQEAEYVEKNSDKYSVTATLFTSKVIISKMPLNGCCRRRRNMKYPRLTIWLQVMICVWCGKEEMKDGIIDSYAILFNLCNRCRIIRWRWKLLLQRHFWQMFWILNAFDFPRASRSAWGKQFSIEKYHRRQDSIAIKTTHLCYQQSITVKVAFQQQ